MKKKFKNILVIIITAILQLCNFIKEETKNLYHLIKENYKPVLKTIGNLIHDICMAAHERWLMNQRQRQLLETHLLYEDVAKYLGLLLRNAKLPKALPLDLENILQISGKPVGIKEYEITIPLVAPQMLPNSLFPDYTILSLNRILDRHRSFCLQRQIPIDRLPLTYYMVVVDMYQLNDMFVTIRVRLV